MTKKIKTKRTVSDRDCEQEEKTRDALKKSKEFREKIAKKYNLEIEDGNE